jgi:hypothetical protein
MKEKRKRPGASKSEALRVAQRVEELVCIRLDGAQWWDVRQYVSEKSSEAGSCWEVKKGEQPLSERQLRRYVRRADAVIEKSIEQDRERAIKRHLARRENMYARALNAGDIRTALAVARDESELLGLYSPKKVELTGKGGGPLLFSVEDAVQADRELEEALGGGDVQPGTSPQVREGSPQVP